VYAFARCGQAKPDICVGSIDICISISLYGLATRFLLSTSPFLSLSLARAFFFTHFLSLSPPLSLASTCLLHTHYFSVPAVPSVSADFVSLIISLGFMFWVSVFKKITNTNSRGSGARRMFWIDGFDRGLWWWWDWVIVCMCIFVLYIYTCIYIYMYRYIYVYGYRLLWFDYEEDEIECLFTSEYFYMYIFICSYVYIYIHLHTYRMLWVDYQLDETEWLFTCMGDYLHA